ncbi:antibiotic biosynthesis monooxygenase [Nocardiopsis sp. NPDC049922]|uniref:antibiotic biosynthesis monooxygenase family protein n=1 Tax=Nocardiopsis sp. NPDC049922 TaxID=3155157 RepID=UPI0033CC7D87
MSGRARVLIWHRAPDDGPGAVEDAYRAISEELAGTPGLLGNELLGAVDDAGRLLVMSEWESLAAFLDWERGADHRTATAPLRPFQDRERDRFFEVYEVRDAFGGE